VQDTPAAAGPDPTLGAEDLRERGLAACLGPGEVVLEIGFGRAEALIGLALARPERAFLGIEISRKRLEKAARRVARAGLSNVRLVQAPAEHLLERVLPQGSLAEVWINFPDPWPKKRHHKRRLLRPATVTLLARALAPGGLLHVATDHEGYAAWIAEVLAAEPALENLHAPEPFSHQRPERVETRYEGEFRAEGRPLHYFDYRRRG
jgi:tRNA (guanine-N7-)-methyltransferase